MTDTRVGLVRADIEANLGTFLQDTDRAADAVEDLTGRTTRASRQIEGAGASFGKLGGAIGAALGVAASAAVALFLKNAVSVSNESANLSRSLEIQFGDMSDAVEAWAERTGKALGRSTVEMQRAADAYGSIFKDAAGTTADAAALSTTFATLALDLAAFARIPVAEAQGKIQAALTGSTESLRKYGIMLTEASVKQRAVQLGLAATTKEVSEQDKVIARANIIWERSTEIQGQAAQQAGTFSGELSRLTGNITNIAKAVGDLIIPALTALMQATNEAIDFVVDRFEKFDLGLQIIINRLKGIADSETVAGWRAQKAAADAAADSIKGVGDAFTSTDRDMAANDTKLRGRIKTIEDFAEAAQLVQYQVARLTGDLPEWQEKTAQLDKAFFSARTELQEIIKAGERWEAGNADVARSLEFLRKLLAGLEGDYKLAAGRIMDLVEAQDRLRDQRAKLEAMGMGQAVEDLQRASGQMGVQSQRQQEAVAIERDLARARLEGATRLMELEAARTEALINRDYAQAERLTMLIGQQEIYNGLVEEVTTAQIQAQLTLQEMVEEYRGVVSGSLGDLFKGIRDAGNSFDAGEWAAQFLRRLSDSILERQASDITDGIFKALGLGGSTQKVQTIEATTLNVASMDGLGGGPVAGAVDSLTGGGGILGTLANAGKWAMKTFGGFFEQGGHLMPGQWGIAGESGAEIISGGAHGVDVTPVADGMGAGVTQIFNIQTPNADSFRKSQRQLARDQRRGMAYASGGV